jgi:FkbM family methyltransferase
VIIDGVALQLHPPGDWLTDHMLTTGRWYEEGPLRRVLRDLQGLPPGVLVDAGAMIGTHSAYLAAFAPHTELHAFEPLPANLALLEANVAPYPTVRVHPVALSDRHRTLQLVSDPANLGHTMAVEARGASSPAVPLDHYQLAQVRLLKVDVEGHEPQVIAGARATIEAWHPLVLIEDWRREYGPLLPGYELAAEWEREHQTYLYRWGS